MNLRDWIMGTVTALAILAASYDVMVQSVPRAIAQQGSIWRARDDVSVGSTVVQVAPQNGARITLACSNRSTSVSIRLGDGTVSPTRGVAMAPQSTLSFTGTSSLSGVSEGGVATIACSEEVR